MTETRAAETESDEPRLVALLTDLEREPIELISALREERQKVVDDESLERDLMRAELGFLNTCVQSRVYGDGFRSQVQDARRSALISEFECLRESPLDSAAALFDLAELRASVLLEGDDAQAELLKREIDRRLDGFDEVDDELREEARERFVSLSTEQEDLDLDEKIALLRESRRVFVELAQRLGDRKMKSLARRLGNVACDRVLAQRLERALTPRGATILENTSLGMLLVVVVLLTVETMVDLEPRTLNSLLLVDATICAFFIAEFLFKLALAPARMSWFLRNAITDLLPAIPAALYFAIPEPGTAETVFVRMARFLRFAWFARYVQALRPLLRLFRLLLFMAKGMDALVYRFRSLLNRNFVFFEEAVLPRGPREVVRDARALSFRALRREHILIRDLPPDVASPILHARAEAVAQKFDDLPPRARGTGTIRRSANERDVPVEHAIEELYALRPEQVVTWLPRNDVLAIDRVVRILNAPLVRALPIIRWFRSSKKLDQPEARVVEFGKRIAAVFEKWRERALYVADLQGIITGPQILDRLATAMVKVSFRPARNLLLFGLFFVIVQLLIGKGALQAFLAKFVATPVLILGAVCAVVLALGFWFKKLAGEAADQFKLTSEASFIGLLELVKRRSQDDDLEFLGKRVFRWDIESWGAAAFMAKYLRAARTGIVQEPFGAPPQLQDELYRVSLLYLHFLDGAVLHGNDVKTNQQLLANLSLKNIRGDYLGYGRRERKRLRKLSLQGGPLFGGPYVWFRCITESVAVEAAKRVTDYNRHCLSIRQREIALPETRKAYAQWLRKRRRREAGRLERVGTPLGRSRFVTTEFNALDFLSVDPLREEHIERVFGRHVLQIMRQDRKAMIREIFGTRPLHELPRAERSLNFYSFYQHNLSNGRVFLAPLFVLRLFGRSVWMVVRKTHEIVNEILSPQAALARRRSARAPFAVALRKIHRMKAPNLLEAMRLRVEFDPAYCGAPPGWTSRLGFEEQSELERDMGFLDMHERDRDEMREKSERSRRRVEELHALVRNHLDLFLEEDADLARRGERAVTIAYVTDRAHLRTLMRAEQWFEETLLEMEARETRLPARTFRRLFAFLFRFGAKHPIDKWLSRWLPGRRVSRRGRRNFKRAWHDGDETVRRTVKAWMTLPLDRAPHAFALEQAQRIYRARDEVSREIAALRAVQSLSVLDVRNYRRLVYELGGYAEDGESNRLAEALP